jgi:hypothetical protein
MWTNRETSPNPLRWSDLDRGYLLKNKGEVFFTCIVEITSPLFWVLPLSNEQEEKYNIIKKKRDEEFTFLEISDYLNTSEYKPQRTDKFTPQQVFGLFEKMNNRIERLNKVVKPKIYEIGILMDERK